MQEAANDWIEFQRHQDLVYGHIQRMEQIVKSDIIPLFGAMKIRELRPFHLEKWIERMRECKRAPSTMNKYILTLKTICNYEVRMGQIPFNPIVGFRLLRGPMVEFQVCKKSDVEQFLRFAEDRYSCNHPWVYVVYVLAFNTGLRASEIFGLRKKDILWDDHLIRVEQTCDRITRTLSIRTKSRRLRLVPLTQSLEKVLKSHQNDDHDSLLFSY